MRCGGCSGASEKTPYMTGAGRISFLTSASDGLSFSQRNGFKNGSKITKIMEAYNERTHRNKEW